MLKEIALTIFIASFAFVVQTNAQTAAANEKQSVIKELIALVNAENSAEQIVEMMDRQMKVSREAVIDSIIGDRPDLAESDKKSLRESINARSEEYSKRFREKLMQKLNYNEMIDEISATVYDKYYTLEEVKDILAFYKTSTGQKMLKTMTPLMAESSKLTQERLIPKIPGILDELQREEKVEIEREINARKPRPKKGTGK
jgi:hypothetical protein